MVSVHTPLPTASTVRETTQPILHYVLSVWKRLQNSARVQINCNWSEALLPVKMPRLEADPRHRPPPQSPTPRRLRPDPSSPRQPLPSFTVVSFNCAGSLNHLNSFFSMMTDNPPDIVLVQEPQTRLNSTFRVPGYTLIPPQVPTSENRKPYACIYVSTTFQQSFAFIPIAIPRPDLVGIRCTPKNTAASASNTGIAPDATPWSIPIFSCYNRAQDHQRSLADYTALFDIHDARSLLMGDFNLHNPIWDPFRAFSYEDLRLSAPLVDQASQNGFSLVSPVGTHTFLPNNLSHRPSVLDLAFASSLLPLVSDARILDSAGSDHLPVLLRIAYPKTPRSRPTPNWKRFDIEKTLPQPKPSQLTPPQATPKSG